MSRNTVDRNLSDYCRSLIRRNGDVALSVISIDSPMLEVESCLMKNKVIFDPINTVVAV